VVWFILQPVQVGEPMSGSSRPGADRVRRPRGVDVGIDDEPRPVSQARIARRTEILPVGCRVGSGTGAVVCRTSLGCVRRFRLRARLGDSITPSPAPATSNRTGEFSASGSPRRLLPYGQDGGKGTEKWERGMVRRSEEEAQLEG
jgi:hypothetical protein